MTTDLQAIFSSLTRYHIATELNPLPPMQAGVTWIWAANGIWKRGVDGTCDILIRVSQVTTVPGLALLVPHARWLGVPDRIPGGLLTALLDHARRAGDAQTISRPIEQQYFVTYRAGLPQPFRLAAPTQDARAMQVSYEMPKQGQRLIDIHSHHSMPAFFSSTDDRDDTGLSISAVVGHIFDRPEIAIRANVYGHHQVLPALALFDHLPAPLRAAALPKRKERHADLDD